MQDTISRVFARYGEEVTVDRAGEISAFRGIFQHTGSKDWQNMEKAYSLLGEIPRGQYMVLAPAGVELQPGDKLQVGSRLFLIRRAENVRWMAEELYSWGLCVEREGDDTWPV